MTRWRETEAGLFVPDDGSDPDLVHAGACRVCGCTEDEPCLLEGADDGLDDFCAWVDDSKTLCTRCA